MVRLSEKKNWDRGLVGAMLLLSLISAVAMSSATASVHSHLLMRHLLWIGFGLAVFLGLGRLDYREWFGDARFVYAAGIIALVLVEFFGTRRLGATRWLSLFGVSFQPSELAKLGTLWMLAGYLSGQSKPLSFSVIGVSLLIVLPPMFLVLIQPDLGTATVFFVIWFGMVWAAGLSWRYLAAMVLLGLASLPVGWSLLREYQRTRVLIFLNPEIDPLGAGYTIIQSTIAIGSGGLLGKGWRAGTQSQLRFLPEHHSDFIFSVIGEEWGFLGCLIAIIAFCWLFMRVLKIARESVDPGAALFAVGVCVWIAYQTCVNMGMVMGLLPVVGVPLPFISYGGTSMVMFWVALGVVQSIGRFSKD